MVLIECTVLLERINKLLLPVYHHL